MTWTKIVVVAAAIPSLTTSEIEFVPTGRTTVATMPGATGTAKSPRNQRYWRVSPSGSDERDPSSTTRCVAAVRGKEQGRSRACVCDWRTIHSQRKDDSISAGAALGGHAEKVVPGT